VCVALLAGCGGDDAGSRAADAPTPTATATATASPAPEPTTAPMPPHERVRFRASDGHRLKGRFTPAGKRAPAIVLVHEYSGGPDQWNPLVPVLHDAGFATLAYRSRDPRELDESILARDAAGAIAALRHRRDVDPDRIGMVGASIGGTTVAYVLGLKPALKVRAGVGLSAVESPNLIDAGDKGRFKPHDLLLISDDHEWDNVDNIKMDAKGKGVTGFKSARGGHGVRLLPEAAVRERLVGWLKARMGR
jgi:hypothetical protein